ncbi:hypothetical protein GCM10010425_21920 [Streptomyces spororaveus]|uniref:Uncharacterized protein n=1 Tax=Streptomyces spororaveus TaxID=284039 RepID=A0ABQ3TQB1_9ACTN|nr:hypothetical protein Sspor_81690 [Streptomyces spororaveus]
MFYGAGRDRLAGDPEEAERIGHAPPPWIVGAVSGTARAPCRSYAHSVAVQPDYAASAAVPWGIEAGDRTGAEGDALAGVDRPRFRPRPTEPNGPGGPDPAGRTGQGLTAPVPESRGSRPRRLPP